VKGYRRTIWIDDEMDKVIHSSPNNLSFNAKLRYVLCGDTPNTSGDAQNASGDAPNTQTDIQNTEMDIQNMKMDIQNAIDRLETLEMWKMDVE
tara:strand:- start:763 stop:1041 length:279 start_codon:yes stop_codon:yes gene_type:complete